MTIKINNALVENQNFDRIIVTNTHYSIKFSQGDNHVSISKKDLYELVDIFRYQELIKDSECTKAAEEKR